MRCRMGPSLPSANRVPLFVDGTSSPSAFLSSFIVSITTISIRLSPLCAMISQAFRLGVVVFLQMAGLGIGRGGSYGLLVDSTRTRVVQWVALTLIVLRKDVWKSGAHRPEVGTGTGHGESQTALIRIDMPSPSDSVPVCISPLNTYGWLTLVEQVVLFLVVCG